MTRIYIVRHAEAEGNLYRRAHGWYNSLITQRGYRQIAALSHRFAQVHIDAVYSSDLFRTMTTARSIYETHGLELHTLPALREINLGDWEDRPWGEILRRDGVRMRQFSTASPEFQAPGGESFAQAGGRMYSAVMDIAKAHPGQTVAVFSHGTVIRQLQGIIRGMDPREIRTLGHADNTAVTYVEVEDGKARLVFENDNSHLTEEISTLAHQTWWRHRDGNAAEPNLWFAPLDMEHDSEIYYQARKEAWVNIHGSLTHFDGDGFVREALEQCRHDSRAVTAAYLGDEMAGIIQMATERDKEQGVGYIPFCYMLPDRRKQGLGVQLLGEAVSVYRPLGRDKLRLRCAPDNHVAQRFYKRYGFHKIGEAQGTRVPLDLMEKYIGYEPQEF